MAAACHESDGLASVFTVYIVSQVAQDLHAEERNIMRGDIMYGIVRQ